jgi:hypothetical protein
MTKFPITIDATRLFFRYFHIPGVTGGLTDARRVQILQFPPGDYSYQVQSGVPADFTFTVTPQGTVDYDHSCDAFLGGHGTSTLQLSGLEVTLDALSLTGADNGGGVLLASLGSTNDDWIGRRTVRLLPQGPYWVQQGSGPVSGIDFALQRDGRFSYRPELDTARGGCLAGAGTSTLTFKGYTVSVDATAVSHLLLIQSISGMKPSWNGKATVVVLPADGFTLQLDSGMSDLVFYVGTTGRVTVGPALTGRLEVVEGGPPIVLVLPAGVPRTGINHWWTNWPATHGYVCENIFYPQSVGEISDAIKTIKLDASIKAVGGGWSFSDAALPFATHAQFDAASIQIIGTGATENLSQVIQVLSGNQTPQPIDLTPEKVAQVLSTSTHYDQSSVRKRSRVSYPAAIWSSFSRSPTRAVGWS